MLKQLMFPLTLQIGHIVLSCFWNLVGVYLIAQNLEPLGPSASLMTVFLLVGLGALLVVAGYRSFVFYVLVSSILALGALSAIVNAFLQAADLWPSDFWRIGGVVLNTAGLIGAVWGIACSMKNIYSNKSENYVR